MLRLALPLLYLLIALTWAQSPSNSTRPESDRNQHGRQEMRRFHRPVHHPNIFQHMNNNQFHAERPEKKAPKPLQEAVTEAPKPLETVPDVVESPVDHSKPVIETKINHEEPQQRNNHELMPQEPQHHRAHLGHGPRFHERPHSMQPEPLPVHFSAGAPSVSMGSDSIANNQENPMPIQIPDFHQNAGFFARGHFWDHPRHQMGPAPAFNVHDRQNTILRVVNRPPDIIIRNTFQEHPKAWIDLRITVDENGVLNVEAGPQGVVKIRNNTRSANQAMDMEQSFSRNQGPQSTDEQDLEDHWKRNRENAHPASGQWGQEFDAHRMPPSSSFPPIVPSPVMQSKVDEQNQTKVQSANQSSNKDQGPSKLGSSNADNEKHEEVEMLGGVSLSKESDKEEVKPVINIDDSMNSGCPTLKCTNNCPGDLKKLDLNSGCPTCECCPVVQCRASCPNGYESDQNGCPICRCVN